MNLTIQQEKDKQAKKDQQVLLILKQKDKEITKKDEEMAAVEKKLESKVSENQNLQKSYKNACDEIQRLLAQIGQPTDTIIKQKLDDYNQTITSLQEKLKKSLEDNKRFALSLQKETSSQICQTDSEPLRLQ